VAQAAFEGDGNRRLFKLRAGRSHKVIEFIADLNTLVEGAGTPTEADPPIVPGLRYVR
jgi:hypothetical protein